MLFTSGKDRVLRSVGGYTVHHDSQDDKNEQGRELI
jgi:hypothetical protein